MLESAKQILMSELVMVQGLTQRKLLLPSKNFFVTNSELPASFSAFFAEPVVFAHYLVYLVFTGIMKSLNWDKYISYNKFTI